MPLLHKKPFVKQAAPHLDPEEEVFLCETTKEVFRDYEAFFQRTILCNSLVWTCSLTGKTNLTYQEALESEEIARRHLASFPDYLQKPILLIARLTHRGRLSDLCDDVFMFAKDRYFVGEKVDAVYNGHRLCCKVLNVVPNMKSGNSPESVNLDGQEDCPGKSPESYSYLVEDIEDRTSQPFLVDFKEISRRRGLFNRDKTKLYLKQHCQPENCVWKVCPEFVKKFKLDNLSIEDVFCGPTPVFKKTPGRRNKTMPKKITEKQQEFQDYKELERVRAERQAERMRAEVERMRRLEAERRKAEEEINAMIRARQKMLEEKAAMKERKRLEMEARKQKMKAEKDRLRENQRVQAKYLKEWGRRREDLMCDDLKELPIATPLETLLPSNLFGDAVAVLEFLEAFGDIYHIKDVFPQGIRYSNLEEGLLDRDPEGLFGDLVQFLLSAVFIEEDEERANVGGEKLQPIDQYSFDAGNRTSAINEATVAAAKINEVVPIKMLTLNSFTVTEILRLHLLSSGARQNWPLTKYHNQQRGGYCPSDDPGLEFRLSEKKLLDALSSGNVYDTEPADRLKLLNVLINKLLMFTTIREKIDENYRQLRAVRQELLHLRWEEQRKGKANEAEKYKKLKELKAKVQDSSEVNNDSGHLTRHQLKKEEELLAKLLDPKQKVDFSEIDESMLTPHLKEVYEQRLADDREKEKNAVQEKKKALSEEIHSLHLGSAIFPLGRDRTYRRFWSFSSVPGLFVEDDERQIGKCLLAPTPRKNTFDNNFLKNNIPSSLLNKHLLGVLDQQKSYQNDKESGSEISSKVMSRASSASSLQSLIEVDCKLPNKAANATKNTISNGVMNSSCDEDSDLEVVCDLRSNKVNDLIGNNVVSTKPVSKQTGWQLENHVGINSATRLNCPAAYCDKVGGTNGESGATCNGIDPVARKPDVVPEPGTCTADISTCLVHGKNRSSEPWSFYSSIDSYNDLTDSLNLRGFREHALKNRLTFEKNQVIDTMMRCDEDSLRSSVVSEQAAEKRTSSKNFKYDTAAHYFELQLREMLLDIEERLYMGNLGWLRDVDRSVWREDIAISTLTENENNEVCPMKTVELLRNALVHIARGVEVKYLKPPLKDAENSKKKQQPVDETAPPAVFLKWESLVQSSTSLPQLFMHLATLDASIMWSRSLLNARCQLCRRKGDAEKMLLCDRCDRGHHMYCLKPKLKSVPTKAWFCPDCRRKERKVTRNKRSLEDDSSDERKEKYVKNGNLDTDSAKEESEASVSESEATGESTDQTEPTDECAVCDKGGMLICCEKCPLSYHLDCCDPPLSKVPRGKWICGKCR